MSRLLYLLVALSVSVTTYAQLDYASIEPRATSVADYAMERYGWLLYRSVTEDRIVYAMGPTAAAGLYDGIMPYLDRGGTGAGAVTLPLRDTSFALPTDSAYVQYTLYDLERGRGVLRVVRRAGPTDYSAYLLGYEKRDGRNVITGLITDPPALFQLVQYLNSTGLSRATQEPELRRLGRRGVFTDCVEERIAYVPDLNCMAGIILNLPTTERTTLLNQLNTP